MRRVGIRGELADGPSTGRRLRSAKENGPRGRCRARRPRLGFPPNLQAGEALAKADCKQAERDAFERGRKSAAAGRSCSIDFLSPQRPGDFRPVSNGRAQTCSSRIRGLLSKFVRCRHKPGRPANSFCVLQKANRTRRRRSPIASFDRSRLAASDTVGVKGGWVTSSSAGGNFTYNVPVRERRCANSERGCHRQ
jgi:hypothetical protein